MPNSEQNIVLSIAGFDPCGGAGVLADVQTLQQCKVQGMAAVTAITAQHEDQVKQVNWQSFDEIKIQLETLFEKYDFHIVKIGIVQNLDTLDQLLDLLLAHQAGIKIIWDPILQSSSGFDFLKGLNVAQLTKVLSKLHLITPNLPEYEQLQQALDRQPMTTNVLLKGGHAEGDDTSDRLILIGDTESQISGHRVKGKSKHGTGCVLSSAIAAGLSKGMKLKTACTFGKRYVEGYLKSGINKLGAHYEIEI